MLKNRKSLAKKILKKKDKSCETSWLNLGHPHTRLWILLHSIHHRYLYTNTVQGGCVTLCVCPFAIETTFPLSNFKTKHIFGILMERVTFLNHLGRRRRLNFFNYFFSSFTAAEGGGCPNGRHRCPNGGAEGATPPEGEGNPDEGGSSRVIYNWCMYII